jgi:hypothetical protein
MSTEIENATVSSESELVENITDIFDSTEDMLVSEAAAQDDVRQSEFLYLINVCISSSLPSVSTFIG